MEATRVVAVDMEEGGHHQKVSRARPYQVELLEKSKKENSIVFLGTGSGKTYIATMMIKENTPGADKKTVFLVNSVPLVNQQAKFIARNAPVRVESFCGADNVDCWEKSDWDAALKRNDVLVMVHQVFLDILNKGYFHMFLVNLLIVDECHHSVGNSPYVQIFKQHYHPLKETDPDRAPHILALTASVVTSKCSLPKFQKKKKQLEELLDSKIMTVTNLRNLLLHVTQPQEVTSVYVAQAVPVRLQDEFDRCTASLIDLFLRHVQDKGAGMEKLELNTLKSDANNVLKKCKRYLSQLQAAIEALGLYSGKKLIDETQNFVMMDHLAASSDELEQEMLNRLARSLECLKKKLDDDMGDYTDSEKLAQFTSGKAKRLFDDICRSRNDHGNLTVIVFVQQRILAPALAALLNDIAAVRDDLSFVRAGYAVGGATKSVMGGGAKSAAIRLFNSGGNKSLVQMLEETLRKERVKLEKTMDDFRNGLLNCVVSTAVLEEGMDVQTCNLVVRFDRIQECRSYIQSKGRARAKPSRFCIMSPRHKVAAIEADLLTFREIERISVEDCHDGSDTSSDDEDDDVEEYDEFFADPSNKLQSARITTNSAVGIVNRYIQSLPTDRFTRLRPLWEFCQYEATLNDQGRALYTGLNLPPSSGFVCRLWMPHLTPYSARPFTGPECLTMKNAKRHVALLACQQLFKDGFLNRALTPKTRKDFLDAVLGGRGSGEADVEKNAKRFYKKVVPPELRCSNPRSGAFVYAILTELSEEAENLKNRSYKPQDHPEKVGIVVDHQLPDSCLGGFRLYALSGVVTVRLTSCGKVFLSEEELAMVRRFQQVSFKDVLACVDPWMVAGGDEDPLIVPMKNANVDMEFLSELLRSTDAERTPTCCGPFEAERYRNSVIMPLHRDGEHFFVQEVMADMVADSFLPHNQTVTFADYYRTKHGLRCGDPEQNMLRVSGADKRHHMFSPVAVNKTKKSTDGDLIFIPDLCRIHPFSASLWREVQMFPFCFERTASLIKIGRFGRDVADQLRLLPSTLAPAVGGSKTPFTELLRSDNAASSPTAADLLCAFTLASAGEQHNLERLEVLGDVFLKYSVGLRLFCDNRSQHLSHEGILSLLRSRIVGNKRLYEVAVSRNLDGLAVAAKLEPHLNFMPLGYSQPGGAEEKLCRMNDEYLGLAPQKVKEERSSEGELLAKSKSIIEMLTVADMQKLVESDFAESDRKAVLRAAWNRLAKKESPTGKERLQLRQMVRISDKSLADVVEALIGCYLLRCGQQGALKLMTWLGLDNGADFENLPRDAFIKSDDDDSCKLNAVNQRKLCVLLRRINVDRLEETLGYRFKEKSFLVQALTHASYGGNNLTESYERLEFLGDAVLDYVITCHLFCLDESFSPGDITSLRSALVCNNAFASVVLRNNLHQHLMYTNNELFTKIVDYQNAHFGLDDYDAAPLDQDEAVRNARTLVESLKLLNEEECPSLENVEVPKVLGDILESIIGAMFLDCKMNLEVVWSAYKRLCPFIDQIIRQKPRNPITQLFELFPDKVNFRDPIVTWVSKVAMMVDVNVDANNALIFKGIGKNKRLAKVAAAKCALRELKRAAPRN